jgi:hypothetical protein
MYVNLSNRKENANDSARQGMDGFIELFGSKIENIKTRLVDPMNEEESEEEEEEDEEKKPVPFNIASIVGIESKRLKIQQIRMNKGEIIKATAAHKQDTVDSIFTSSANPGTSTMSLYHRPKTGESA